MNQRRVHMRTVRRLIDGSALARLPHSQRTQTQSVEPERSNRFLRVQNIWKFTCIPDIRKGGSYEADTSNSSLHHVFYGHAGSCICPESPNRFCSPSQFLSVQNLFVAGNQACEFPLGRSNQGCRGCPTCSQGLDSGAERRPPGHFREQGGEVTENNSNSLCRHRWGIRRG